MVIPGAKEMVCVLIGDTRYSYVLVYVCDMHSQRFPSYGRLKTLCVDVNCSIPYLA